MESLQKESDLQTKLQKLKNYDYTFENLSFEGGGAKMAAYVGAVKVLEELGILQNCKRFAGTSGGSIIASLLAIGLNASEVRIMMNLPIKNLLIDSWFGAVSMVPNVMKKFGWNPASKFLDAIKKILEDRTGNPNITFREVYKRYKKVLCIVATNVSTMSVEYFHPKTTPDFPVAIAIRCSVSLPGYLQPVRHVNEAGLPQFYVDGGLVCNFPLHCFDGWYLSMKTEDSYFNKLGGKEPPFEPFNPKTLGFLLYTAWEGEFMQGHLHTRLQDQELKRPGTTLSKSRRKRCDELLAENERKHQMVEAGKRFLQTLREVDVDRDCEISLVEFKEAFDKLKIKSEDVELLFGENFHFEQAFKDIDRDTNGKITFDEFLWYMQKKGIRFRALLEGGNMMQINTFGEFFETTFNTILNMTRKVHFKELDVERTVGIYTDYVDTTDFNLQEADKDFIIRQGIIGTLVYFRDLLDKYGNGKLPEAMCSCITPKVTSEEDIVVTDKTKTESQNSEEATAPKDVQNDVRPKTEGSDSKVNGSCSTA